MPLFLGRHKVDENMKAHIVTLVESPSRVILEILKIAQDSFQHEPLSRGDIDDLLEALDISLENKQIVNALSRLGNKVVKIKNNGETRYRISAVGRKEIDQTPVDLGRSSKKDILFDSLLHPIVKEHAYSQFLDGHLRDAVLNAFIAVFEMIRQRTALDMDGSALATFVFSPNDPLLVLSSLDTESGRNDQLGFMQIFQGTYIGIRSPKAHTLIHDLNEHKAAQYLVFASLLARRVEESILQEGKLSRKEKAKKK